MATSAALSREGYNVGTGEPVTLLDHPQANSLEFLHRLCHFLPINLLPNLSIPLRKNNSLQRGGGVGTRLTLRDGFQIPKENSPFPGPLNGSFSTMNILLLM